MSESLVRHEALAGAYQTGRFGADQAEPGIRIQQLHGLSIIQVAAFPDTTQKTAQAIKTVCGFAPAEQALKATAQDDIRILWNGPQRWWIVQPEDLTLAQRLSYECGVDAALTEHSQGRVVLRLRGPALRDLLAKGSTVDFHPSVFQPGWSRPLALEHFDVQLHCLDNAPSADIYIPRSLALSFWEWLIDAAGEFGGEVLPFENKV